MFNIYIFSESLYSTKADNFEDNMQLKYNNINENSLEVLPVSNQHNIKRVLSYILKGAEIFNMIHNNFSKKLKICTKSYWEYLENYLISNKLWQRRRKKVILSCLDLILYISIRTNMI